MKKLLLLVASLVLVFGLAACGGAEEYEIAMITDSGGIDDQSFNQGTWEGIEEFAAENDLTYKYYKPLEVSDDAYLDAIELAIEGGAQIVVTPGFLFESSIYKAQDLYPEVKFVLIDGVPHDAAWENFKTADNTLPILFKEQESGFLAGYAAVKEGYTNLGFTGGMAVPAVVKFGVGYIAGAYYAADEMGVTLDFGDDTYTYFGNFEENDTNKSTAAAWYQEGTEIIFSAAGGAGSSVMSAAADADTMMIGVDVDQTGQSDTVLTSAMKMLGEAVQQALQAYVDGNFPGGETQVKGVENDGVGLPMDTSRFDTFDQAAYDAIYSDLVDGTVTVPSGWDDLQTFLADLESYTDSFTQAVVAPE
ncbi:MAG: BMP family ABC transporter substrate-binding protein [Candidatus Izimaplasma sp.]|nr:BMP family ABC transporter substrate-binding protein [Candidatus Izimaplasma bacterium]